MRAELACGGFARREEVIRLLERLPSVAAVSDREARAFPDAHDLAGRGVGWVDVHLLAAGAQARPPC